MALPIEQFFNDLKYYLNQNSVSDEQSICSDTQYNWYYRKDKPLHNIFTCSFDDNYQNIITHTWNFIKLPSNWDGYDSDKLSHDVIQNAINLINNISYQSVEILEIEDVNPTSNGTIVIEWFYNDKKLSLEVGTNTANYFTKTKDKILFKKDIFKTDDYIAVNELSDQLNSLFN
jgi:hypothetical protein